MTWKDGITLFLAILGAGLGILNTWQALRKDRVRLRITPKNVVTNLPVDFGIEW